MRDDSSRIRAKRMKKMRDGSLKKLGLFSDTVFDRVQYVASLDPSPDGFPTDTRFGPRGRTDVHHTEDCKTREEGDCNCSVVADESSSTEAAALRLLEGKKRRDPQQTACARIDSAFQAIWKELDAAEHAWDVILNASDAIRTREAQSTLGTCRACTCDVPNVGEDRIKSGYCQSCYRAWLRTDTGNGRQDRLSFESARRQLRIVPGETAETTATGYQVDEIDQLVSNGTLPRKAASA
jgi:hypothetical protein